MSSRIVEIRPGYRVGGGEAPLLLAGPCALEGPQTLDYALAIAEAIHGLGYQWVFKASFDKANRTSAGADRGLGLEAGLDLLGAIRERLGVPVVTDVHLPDQCAAAAQVADVLQIPAFLSRQTDLLIAAAETGRTVNVKKGQFMAPGDMAHAAGKVASAGNERVLLTERGTFFGYGRLVVDFASLPELRAPGYPVIFDATHSVQQPGGLGDRSGGDWTRAPILMRAAAAAGVDGYFVESHPRPETSPSDGPNMIPTAELRGVLERVFAIHELCADRAATRAR
ncbi:MAG TPA: 3-deoxy-8-phosphooctulonate synthase [Planctomycetota bacterium]